MILSNRKCLTLQQHNDIVVLCQYRRSCPVAISRLGFTGQNGTNLRRDLDRAIDGSFVTTKEEP